MEQAGFDSMLIRCTLYKEPFRIALTCKSGLLYIRKLGTLRMRCLQEVLHLRDESLSPGGPLHHCNALSSPNNLHTTEVTESRTSNKEI